MSGLSRATLAAACADHGLACYGSKLDLTHRLDTHLVEQKLGAQLVTGKKRAASDVATLDQKRVKRPVTKWQAFMKSEMPNIKASGYMGLTDCIKELARRWALVKKVGTSKQPLFFSDTGGGNAGGNVVGTMSDAQGIDELGALADVIKDLPHAEVKDALVAHGQPVSESAAANAQRLALVVYI